MNRLFILILAVFWLFADGQDFSRTGSSKQLDGLPDQEKVRFINKNFYKLYSTDFTNATELAQWAAETSIKNKWREEDIIHNL